MSVTEALASIVGRNQLFEGDEIEARYRNDSMNRYPSNPQIVVRPSSTQEVVEIVKVAQAHGEPIIAMGGTTGTTGGLVSEGGLTISMERMNKIYEIDRQSMTITVDAGITLQAAQDAAEAEGMLLPLDLGSRGSATIGGAISTNAGGSRVLRWGMTRDMVLGVEAVLADGTVVSALTKVLKDNAGYDWKQLMIGSEGTLGIVTKAVLRLRPMPTSAQTALIAVNSLDDAVEILRTLEGELAGRVSSFELMWGDFYDYIAGFQAKRRPQPMKGGYPLYCLLEALGGHPDADQEAFEGALGRMIESGQILDAVLAQSERERQALWLVRDDLVEAFNELGDWMGFDISMPHADMNRFIKEARANIASYYPDALAMFYGHVGDGNLHLVSAGPPDDPNARHNLDIAVYEAVQNVSGSISGEHGVGIQKRDFIHYTRSEAELALMRTIKKALDPNNILNPGKVINLAA